MSITAEDRANDTIARLLSHDGWVTKSKLSSF
jgi:hypothetical protein